MKNEAFNLGGGPDSLPSNFIGGMHLFSEIAISRRETSGMQDFLLGADRGRARLPIGGGLLAENAEARVCLNQGGKVKGAGGVRNERQTITVLAQTHGRRSTRPSICNQSLEVGEERAQAAAGRRADTGQDSALAFAGSIVGEREYRGGLAEVYIIFLFGHSFFLGR